MKKSQACAELEAQNAGDGRAGSEVDAAFGVGGLSKAVDPLVMVVAMPAPAKVPWNTAGPLNVDVPVA